MISFDVKELARNMLIPHVSEPNVREHLVCELLRGALEIFNDPHRENAVIIELEEVLENDYEVMGTEDIVTKILATLRRASKGAGWDGRTIAKLEYKQIGKAFHQAKFVMDLDETVARVLEANAIKPDKEHVTDMVSDHPDMDAINELNTLHSRETSRRIPVLSDRFATVVREDEESGWRVSDWESFGKR